MIEFIHNNIATVFFGFFLILSSIGVITLKNPVHASLSFLMTLLFLAGTYIYLNAEFIGIMQVLVYAGAILVIFMFVIILFQDAHAQISLLKPKAKTAFLVFASVLFILGIFLILEKWTFLSFNRFPFGPVTLDKGHGSVETLGKALYIDYFFPFEAVVFLFLVSIIGAFYIGKRETYDSY